MRPPTIPTTIAINPKDSKLMIKMKTLYNALIEYREPKTQRILVQVFMCLPSRKDFPEYFNIIEKPIAMNKIRDRIERQQYEVEDMLMDDFKLMFGNCKIFNEDDSLIYQDAVCLENLLQKKLEELNEQEEPPVEHKPHLSPSKLHSSSSTSGGGSSSPAKNSSNNNNIVASNGISSSNINNNSNNNKNNINKNRDDTVTQQSDSTNHSSTTDNQNGNDESMDITQGSIRVNHNHHLETSMDSSSNLSADLLASTPVEKCSLNTRRGKNADAPKRQLLTGYIIYASEIRKQVIDKNPNQNFGDISRLVGNEWKALPHDIRSKYDQRALIHNKRVREKAQRELNNPVHDSSRLLNGLSTPKLTKRKLAKLAKEQMRQHHLSLSGHDDSLAQSPRMGNEHSSSMVPQTPNSTYKHPHHPQQHSQPQSTSQASSSKNTTAETSTQTTVIRFVEPPTKKRLVYSDTFRRYIESLQVPNRDLLAEETAHERPPEPATHWLGAGIGRHESPEAALWALRDFMLQDAVTMRKSMEPYL